MSKSFVHSAMLCTAIGALFALPCMQVHAVPISVKDGQGRNVVINDTRRIISVGGAITEILYALGKDRQIVAVDSTSLFPAQALKEKPDVGYMRQLSPEGVLGLNPSLLLTIEGAGPKETINVLEASGIPMVSVPDHYTGAGVIEKIALVSASVDAAEQGKCLGAALGADLDALGAMRGKVGKPARVMFLMSMAGDRLLVAGKDTAADGIIRLAGAANAISDYSGYKALTDEAVVSAAPDFVLTMQRGRQPVTTEEVFAHPAFKLTPAAARKAHVSFDGLYMLGFGPRTALAARDLMAAFYPQAAVGKLPSEQHAPSESCRK